MSNYKEINKLNGSNSIIKIIILLYKLTIWKYLAFLNEFHDYHAFSE